MANPETTPYTFQLDPELLAQAQAFGSADIQIDPALFELAQVVEDARRGKLSLGEDEEMPQVEGTGEGEGEGEVEGQEEEGEGVDDIDPALREIVNSLTAAQQVRSTCLMKAVKLMCTLL
jgi:hypothetical protein